MCNFELMLCIVSLYFYRFEFDLRIDLLAEMLCARRATPNTLDKDISMIHHSSAIAEIMSLI